MIRDMDLIRKILIKLKESPKFPIYQIPKIDNYNENDIHFHLLLLADAGLIIIDSLTTAGGKTQVTEIKRITWEGYDFIEAIVNIDIWEKAKRIIKDKGLGIIFPILKSILISLVKEKLNIN